MNTKFFLLSTLMLGLLATSSQGAALFPSIVDPGPYDAVEDDLEAGTSDSVQGLYFDNGVGATVDASDEIFVIYGITAVDTVPVSGPYMAIAMSGVVTAGAGPSGSLLVSGNGLSTNSLGNIVGNSSADIAILTSSSLDFSTLSAFTDISEITSLFGNSAVNVEGLFGLSFANVGTDLSNLSLVFGGEKISTTFEPVNFIPVSINRAAPIFGSVGTADVVAGSGSFLETTTLGATGVTATGFALTGNGIGAVNPIPEPASLLTLLGCVAGVGAMGRRRRKAAAAA